MNGVIEILGFAFVALLAVAAVLFGLVGVDVLRGLTWATPWWVLTALIPLATLGYRTLRTPRPAALQFSRVRSARRIARGWATRLIHAPDGLRLASILLVAVALGRPQSTRGSDRIIHEGIEIVLALDLSNSMSTPDMVPTRLEAAKFVIDDFIDRRPHDRIGLVVFGSGASTVSPLTVDHGVLRELIRRLNLGMMDGSSTAIGAGLGVALNRLDESSAKTRLIVLLTDGVQTASGLDPDAVATEAAERGVQIYTVLMGYDKARGDSIDPAQLERLASVTGGYSYTAADQSALQGTFQQLLDQLERSSIEGQQVRPELFQWLLWPALVLLVLDIVLRTTRLRRFP